MHLCVHGANHVIRCVYILIFCFLWIVRELVIGLSWKSVSSESIIRGGFFEVFCGHGVLLGDSGF